MNVQMNRGRWSKLTATALVAITLAAVPGMAQAKGGGGNGGGGGRNDSRVRWTGIVQARPAGLIGNWVVGGRSFTTTGSTEFDQLEGPLNLGSCAKVDIRNGAVHEVDSEPARDCR